MDGLLEALAPHLLELIAALLTAIIGWLAAQAKARAAGQQVEIVVYPDAPHGFHADYRPSYRQADAVDAWNRATGWLRAHGV